MRDRLSEALKKSDADYTDIRFETEDSTSVSYRGREVERVASSLLSGGIVRACTRGGWGMAIFDSPDDLERQVEEACRAAALVGKEKTELAETDFPTEAVVPARMEHDFRGVPLDEKLALVAGYNDILLTADPAIETTSCGYWENFRTVHFASSRGAYFMEERPYVGLSFSATARDGALVQSSRDSRSSATTYDVVLDREECVLETARRAPALLRAPKVEGGAYTVVLDQRLGGVFIHEAFGHLSEADFLYENQKMRELMVLGRPMGVKELNVVDDGSLGRLIGTHPYDDEGTPTRKHYLIREGVLVGHLHSLETAGKMGEAPTGNARAIRRGVPPIVRMTNTTIEGGSLTPEELFAGVDKGIYACSMLGGQTQMEQFTFSSAYAYRIEKGQKGELIRDVVLTGNVFQTLNAIDGFANDFKIIETGGGCGKGGQSPLPVTFGAPHIRIRDVVVGGK